MSSTRTWGTVNIHHYWTGNYTQQHVITNATLGLILVLQTLSGLGTSDFNIPECNNRDAVLLHRQADLSRSVFFFLFFLQKVSGLLAGLCGCTCLFLTGNCFIWVELPALPEESIQLIYLGCLGSMALDWMQYIHIYIFYFIFFNFHRLKWWYSVMKWCCNRTFSSHGSFSIYLMHHKTSHLTSPKSCGPPNTMPISSR